MREQFNQAREQAESAVRAMTQIRDKYLGKSGDAAKWSPEDKENFEKANQDFAKWKEEGNRIKGQMEAFEALERHSGYLNNPVNNTLPISGNGVRNTGELGPREAHQFAQEKYLRLGLDALSNEEQRAYWGRPIDLSKMNPGEVHALVSTNNSLGGFLSTDDVRTEIIQALSTTVAVRAAGARVMNTAKQALSLPKVTPDSNDKYPSGFAGSFKKEAATTGGTAPTVQNQPTFQRERIPVHIWQPDAIEFSMELLEDADVNLEQVLTQIIAQTRSLDEEDKFINGTGVNEPEGVLLSGATTSNSGNNTNWTYNGIIDLYTALPIQYRRNATWLMSSATYGLLLKLQDSQNRPLLDPYKNQDELLGRPIQISEFMPTGAVQNNKSIVFGDWFYYVIAERKDLRIQRLVERFAPNVGILATTRIGGQCVLPNAFRIGKTSA